MSNFGKAQEVKENGVRKLWTGVENFKVVAVNPTKEELEEIYGREINYDVNYISENTVSDTDGERSATQARIDFFLSNEDPSNLITTKISYYITNTHHKSQTGKIRVINDFGKTTWLTEEQIKTKQIPDNMHWYKNSGVKVAKRGEEELLDFIINLLNLPFDLSKVNDPSEAYARFTPEDWKKMFNGDFSLLKTIISSTGNKVGLALGVKTKADGQLVQTVYNRMALRQYILSGNRSDKFKWLHKNISESKANGAFGNVDFGDASYALTEYTVKPTQLSLDSMPETDVFAAEEDNTSDWL